MNTTQAPILDEFGRRIRRARTANGLSQEAFADLAGFHRTYISAIERGKRNPSLINVIRLAKSLNIDPSKLVEGLAP